MEPLPPFHLISSTNSQEQKLMNRETSIVELPGNAPAVGQRDADAGDRACGEASSGQITPAAPALPAIVSTSPLSSAPAHSFSVQQYSPSQPEINQHPIRQRLNLSVKHVAASGRATKKEERESLGIGRQENIEAVEGAKESKMTEVKEGDKVAWNWGSGAPGGVASEVVTDGEAKMVSHRGNEVKKQGSPDNPAVHIERPGNDVVKKASELEVEQKGPNHADGEGEKKEEGAEKKDEEKKDESTEKKEEANGEAKTGEKRSASEANNDEEKDGEAKTNGDAATAEPPKKKGRPAKSGAGGAKKETKKKAPKPAATADGKPRRSGRNKS